MKKIPRKQRERDITIGLLLRRGGSHVARRKAVVSSSDNSWLATKRWIDDVRENGLNLTITKRRGIILYLPETMNFYDQYDSTVLHITAIRRLSIKSDLSRKAYRLNTVNFDSLRRISTSAALVLTAELSKWDDAVRQRLRPMIDRWDPDILRKFTDLGFFDLFRNSPLDNVNDKENPGTSNVKIVRYIKGRCGDSKKTRILKDTLTNIVGETITKWTFLRCGLDEAITNVSHHAYPNKHRFADHDKNWYLTGAFDEKTRELKIVFYDQGIGIPKSLPASDIWERVLKFLSRFPAAERKSDEVLLKAAVELDRTSTGENDRGKGLQDLLEFIRQRGNGYLSILSLRGLFKYSMNDGKESKKSEHFDNPICGTLIIWSAILVN